MRTALILSLWTCLLPALTRSHENATIPEAAAYPTTAWQELPQGRVIEVLDSDTLSIEFPAVGMTLEIDLAGVHGPGIRQPFGPEAAFFTRSLSQGEEVRVAWADGGQPDARGRRRGVVYRVPDGLCLNLELVRAGLAKPKPSDSNEIGEELGGVIETYAARAESLGRGWIGGAEPISAATPRSETVSPTPNPDDHANKEAHPDDQHAQAPRDSEKLYVTKSGSKYHRASCRFVTDSATEITLEEAHGHYEPCKVCHPPTLEDPDPAQTDHPDQSETDSKSKKPKQSDL